MLLMVITKYKNLDINIRHTNMHGFNSLMPIV